MGENESSLSPNPFKRSKSTVDSVHKCPECQKGYQHRRLVVSHMRTAHNITLPIRSSERKRPASLIDEMDTSDSLTPEGTTDDELISESPDAEPEAELEETLENNAQNSEFECDYCDKKFTRRHSRKDHVDSVHKHIRYECPECKQLFIKNSVGKHMFRVHKMKLAVTDLRKVVTDVESRDDSPQAVPEEVSESDEQLMQNSNNKRELTISYCDKTFSRRRNRDEHIQSVHENIRYECPECKTLFSQRSSVIKHLCRTHQIYITKSQIGTIRKLTVKESNPIKSFHGNKSSGDARKAGVDNLPEDIRDEGTKLEQVLLNEQTEYKEPSDTSDAAYEDSGDEFMPEPKRRKKEQYPQAVPEEVSESDEHFLQNSNNKKEFKCSYCDKKFNHLKSRNAHVDSSHKNIRYKCPECKTLFSRRNSVTNHLRRTHKIKITKSEIGNIQKIIIKESNPTKKIHGNKSPTSTTRKETSGLSEILTVTQGDETVVLEDEPENVTLGDEEIDSKMDKGTKPDQAISESSDAANENSDNEYMPEPKRQKKLRRHMTGVHNFEHAIAEIKNIRKLRITESNPTPRSLNCEYCPKTFDRVDRKTQHINFVHKNIRYECSECQTVMACKGSAVRHVRKFHGIESPTTEIREITAITGPQGGETDINGKTDLEMDEGTKPEQALLDEQTEPSNNDKSSNSEESGDEFMPEPKRRKKERLSTDAIFNCTECSASFGTKNHLIRHLENDHDKTKFECPRCQKQYRGYTNTEAHLRNVHHIWDVAGMVQVVINIKKERINFLSPIDPKTKSDKNQNETADGEHSHVEK